ncbi:hypothetical protein [Mycobacterium sp. 141]|uniref:hypothetical protein n=1 Tax=Mycobacterium sp. 141 TaxID=1120797 RepID=UPI00037D3FEB|nr:hypothetical protein [Mycobacterium sp. 141]
MNRESPLTAAQWLAVNLADVLVAVAQAGATLAGSNADDDSVQVDPRLQEGS